ncbi:UV radiation resistance protein and autophagy-related subunit 14-domain-containing protein [Podospora fimiseda]|uniref:Autophagy-related protein 14 n=1 Tax=Podospora fimiseda TaxID=252190 RepID=A0AAN7BU14_9PEZI|nr:UV radiation resistance protein and autophagy-related subunit 14-domain-containing protein [Podospora fimiseda]
MAKVDGTFCSICSREHHAKKQPFLCAVDARNLLYESRVEDARILIENEELEQQIGDILSGQAGAGVTPKQEALDSAARLERLKSEERASLDRTSEIIARADRLRSEIDAARKEIEAKKDALARKKSDLASVSAGTVGRRNRQLEDVERSIQRIRYKWNRSADTMAATRAFLCEEAARLYGLRQVKKGSVKRYEIGTVEIFDVHTMNNLQPHVISTVLAHITHILVLASHYLAFRLPAEITLPQRNQAHPTIWTLASSYKHGDAPPKSDGEDRKASGARPLFVDKTLPTLAKEDPSAYAFFLEGVGLLVYNVAWACCAQGVPFGSPESYEDVANMGQNLWRLLIGDQIHRRSVEPVFPSSLTPSSGSPRDRGNSDATKPRPMIGRWSHGTAHTSLAKAEGTEFLRNFKLIPPAKLIDRLKKRLSTNVPMIEWENIEGDEVREVYDGESDDLGVASIMSVRTAVGSNRGGSSGSGSNNAAAAARGTSGWTRIKPRVDRQ